MTFLDVLMEHIAVEITNLNVVMILEADYFVPEIILSCATKEVVMETTVAHIVKMIAIVCIMLPAGPVMMVDLDSITPLFYDTFK